MVSRNSPGMKGVFRSHPIEAEAINRLRAVGHRRLEPFPCGESDETRRRKVRGRTDRLLISAGWKEGQKFRGLRAEVLFRLRLETITVVFCRTPPSSRFQPASNATSFCFFAANIAGTLSGRKYPSTSGPNRTPCGG